VPYLSASEVVFREEALYQVYIPLPLHFAVFATERSDVTMIRCSNADCHRGAWFHIDCVGIEQLPDGDWWCSRECRQTERSIFCVCKQVHSGRRINCSNDSCNNGAIFHLHCVNLQKLPGIRPKIEL